MKNETHQHEIIQFLQVVVVTDVRQNKNLFYVVHVRKGTHLNFTGH